MNVKAQLGGFGVGYYFDTHHRKNDEMDRDDDIYGASCGMMRDTSDVGGMMERLELSGQSGGVLAMNVGVEAVPMV
jgi:hypothetical protein